jgi:hypothetical protein
MRAHLNDIIDIEGSEHVLVRVDVAKKLGYDDHVHLFLTAEDLRTWAQKFVAAAERLEASHEG